jgi:hypothetical protein
MLAVVADVQSYRVGDIDFSPAREGIDALGLRRDALERAIAIAVVVRHSVLRL